MTPEDEQKFKDFIFQAVQSGKKETSGLVDEILYKMGDHIEEAINKNSKLNLLSNNFHAYVKEDNAWKVKAEPVIKMGENVQGFSKVSLYIVGFIASVTGAIYAIINLHNNK